MVRVAGIERRAECDADAEFLVGLYGSTRREELAPVPWSDAQKDAFIRMQFAAQRQHYRAHYPRDTRFEVIECDGERIGRWYEARFDGERRLMDVALMPSHRNRGIGTALVRELMEQAARDGDRVTLHVEFFNPAMHLYTRLGFHPVEQRGVYWLMEWTPARQHTTPGGVS